MPENLGSCLLICVRQLATWVHAQGCPNYFIPEENIFDRIDDKIGDLVILYYIINLLQKPSSRLYWNASLRSKTMCFPDL